jgi:single-stranded-DNA-specific exonuclease
LRKSAVSCSRRPTSRARWKPTARSNPAFEVLNQRLLKDKHLKLKLQKGGQRFDAIRFNFADSVPDRIRAAFRVDINEWNGMQTVQLMLEHLEPA